MRIINNVHSATVLALFLCFAAAGAFYVPVPSNAHALGLVGMSAGAGADDSLSDLVGGMLSAEQEMSKELRSVSAKDRMAAMPEAGDDGVYHIFSEEQYK
jgi:hypothetical protein